MNNLLPRFESFVIDGAGSPASDARQSKRPDDLLEKYKSWRPEHTVVTATTVLPFGLPITADYGEVLNKKAKAVGNLPAPNDKFLPDPWDEVEASLLDERSRGQADSVRIFFDDKDKSKIEVKSDYKPPKFKTNIPLIVRIFNHQAEELDVFVQRNSTIFDVTVRPNAAITKLVAGELEVKKAYSTMDILVSVSENIFIATTVRQEVRDFQFGVGPIGIEAEMVFGRLTCTRVLPDSQAEAHAQQLENSVILAVNDIRVTTMDEFRGVVVSILTDNDNNFGNIVMKALVYKSQKIKLDALYAQSLQKNNNNVTTLLSSLLRGGGRDAEHQHDVELRARDDESDDDASGSVATLSTSTYGYAPARRKEAKRGNGHKDDPEEQSHKRSPSPPHSADECDAKSTGGSASEAKGGPAVRDDEQGLLAAKTRNNRSEEALACDDASAISLDDDERSLADRSLASQPQEGMFITEIDSAVAAKHEENNGEQAQEHGFDLTGDDPDHIERSDIGPYTKVLCVPAAFLRSRKWGAPRDFLQITNYSSNLCVQLYWVDTEGALIPRKLLGLGERHVDLISSNHVYALVALPRRAEGGAAVDYSALSAYVLQAPRAPSLLLRPCAAALVRDRCTSIT